MDDGLVLQLPQLLGQHLLGDARDQALDLAKPQGAGQQVVDDQDLPFAPDDVHRGLNRAREPLRHVDSILLVTTLLISTYLTILYFNCILPQSKSQAPRQTTSHTNRREP